jgi:hypothetical protein
MPTTTSRGTRMDLVEAEGLCRDIPKMPRSAWEKLREDEPEKFNRFMDYYLTAKCLTSFKHFVRHGVYWRARAHNNSDMHDRMIKFLQDWTISQHGVKRATNLKFVMVARDHCKSQLAIAWLAWQFARNPNVCILIRSWTSPKAFEIQRALRQILESHDYQRRFDWVKPKLKSGQRQKELWGNDGLMLERTDVGVRVPSCEACGHEKDPTGGHFDFQLCDDFAVDSNENSEVLRPQLYEVFQNDNNVLSAGSQRLVLGTTWRKDGFMDQARTRSGIFEDMDYGLFLQPVVEQAFAHPLTGTEIEMAPDRQTFRLTDNEVPDAAKLCQARLTFDTPDLTDTDIIVREVTGANGREFTINRPVESIYDQPRAYLIGNERPAAPNRYTMDSADHIPETPSEEEIPRKSIERAKSEQGPLVWGCQMLLDPLNRDDLLFNADDIVWVQPEDLPTRERVWYRKCDLASQKETGSFTAMIEGFITFDGVFITHLEWGNLDTMDIMMELFRGVIRLQRKHGAVFRHTQFEEAHIEHTLKKLLPYAERDPYDFFVKAGGKYEKFADKYLINEEGEHPRVNVRIHSVTRGRTGKMDRISHWIDPELKRGRIHIVEGIANADRIIKEISEATLDSKVGIDVIDALSDLVSESRTRPKEKRPEVKVGTYTRINLEAQRKVSASRRAVGGWG